MSRSWALTPRPIASSPLANVAGSSSASDRICTQPPMVVSGPRSSWETVATNSSLSWSAASARSRASCSSANRTLASLLGALDFRAVLDGEEDCVRSRRARGAGDGH